MVLCRGSIVCVLSLRADTPMFVHISNSSHSQVHEKSLAHHMRYILNPQPQVLIKTKACTE